MSEHVKELGRQLRSASATVLGSLELGDWEQCVASLREVLSLASKLHQRAAVMRELGQEAQFIAEVDRAVSKVPPQIPGQRTFAEEFKAVRDRKPRPPRKGK